MKYFDWDDTKNRKLKKQRSVSFEQVFLAIQQDKTIEIIDHPNKKRYPNQKLLIIELNNYVYMVLYIEDNEKYFLKTIIPSRKMTKKYLKGGA